MTKYTEIDDAEFTRDWVEYVYIKNMAEKYDVSEGTVVNHAERLGLSPRLGPRKKRSDERREN